MLGHLVFGNRTPVEISDDVDESEGTDAVIIELPLPSGRIQAGEWPDDLVPVPAPTTAVRRLTVVS